MAGIATATLTDPINFYVGRPVNVLSREKRGEVEVCKVEIADHPGLTTHARIDNLSDYTPYPADDDDGQPDEAQEWADFDPDC